MELEFLGEFQEYLFWTKALIELSWTQATGKMRAQATISLGNLQSDNFARRRPQRMWWPLSTQMIPVQRVETCTGWYRGIISLFSKVIKKSQRETEHTSIRVINPSKASCDFPYVSKIQFSIFCVWQTPDFWRCRFYILVLLNWYNRRRQNQSGHTYEFKGIYKFLRREAWSPLQGIKR